MLNLGIVVQFASEPFALSLQPIGNIAERFHALCLKDSGVLYEDPYIQVNICP